MNILKKIWIAIVAILPGAGLAAVPFVVGGIAGLGAIAGFSIYRSMAPVNMADAMSFFSACWSCDMFSAIISAMSNLLPGVYHALGLVIIPIAIGLTALWLGWTLLSGYLNIKVDNPLTITTNLTRHMIKLAFVITLMAAPLPRMISTIAIEPIFNIGLSLNRAASGDDAFASCIVATAIADPASISADAANSGAFSPHLRHNLTCEIANVHQITGLGMTVGWTMLNMAFNDKYMHKIMWDVPIFPNVPIFLGGLLILLLFFFALLPVPLYFLDALVTLSMDLIMLPLFLLGWVFKDWKIIPGGGAKSIQEIINNAVKATVGIALVGTFVTFAIMFLNAVFGHWDGAATLGAAMAQNDPSILMDGLMMQNDSLITVVLMGLFIAMFMTMIPQLVKMLFKVEISSKTYDKVKKDLETLWKNVQKIYAGIKK